MKHFLTAILFAVLSLLPVVGCTSPAQDRAKLKKEIKREIMAELGLLQQVQKPASKPSENERAQLKKEIETEILAKLQAENQALLRERSGPGTRRTQVSTTVFGRAEGQILREGSGLPDCRVKLVRISKSNRFIDLFNAYQEGTEFETVTNAEGNYRFEKIPVGDYKIKWQLPDDKGWIRRLRDKPDVTVKEGQTSHLTPVETYRKLLPH